MFVVVRGIEHWGVGKIVGFDGDLLVIEYFDSPAKRHQVKAAKADVVAKVIEPNSRTYLHSAKGDSWKVGRVLHDDGISLEVRLPGKTDLTRPHAEAFVRWRMPIDNAVEFLACGIADTPRYSQGRSRFLSNYLAQRGATGGMSALLSSAIELNSHQIEVVRRVLNDPTPRYLLADEVGLGKTIEAGILIRQAVLDDPRNHSIHILVPPAIEQQWRSELQMRFGLTAYLDRSVIVAAHGDAAALDNAAATATMRVVDEAHRLTSPLNQDERQYSVLARCAERVPKLILMSATPALRNEGGFLRMLHLIDPLLYPLNDLKAFRQRVQHRQSLAEVVAALDPDNALFLDPYLDDLEATLPNDERLSQLISTTRTQLRQAAPSEEELDHAVRALKAHVSETYRLHRRILRNRRRHITWLTPNRKGAELARYESRDQLRVDEAYENWRIGAATSFDRIDKSEQDALVNFNFDLLNSLLTNPNEAQAVALRRVQSLRNSGVTSSGEIPNLLAITDLAQRNNDSRGARLQCAAGAIEALASRGKKVVVFCSQPSDADDLLLLLQRKLGDRSAVRHSVSQETIQGEDPPEGATAQFLSDVHTNVIVCDSAAEEGLNLQGGRKAMVHYDLPLDPNRIEQRLGRVDRYASGDAIESTIVVNKDSAIEIAWFTLLSDGLGVFNRSASSLQYLIEEKMAALRVSVFLNGVEAIYELTGVLTGAEGEVRRELQSLDAQDALDELTPCSEEAIDRVLEVDSDWTSARQAVQEWARDCLLFEERPSTTTSSTNLLCAPFRYCYMPPGRGGDATLIPLSSFVDRFLGAVDHTARGSRASQPMSFRHSHHRGSAIRAKVRPMRYGSEFTEALKQFSDLDDRGRSYVCWRQVKNAFPLPSPQLYFRMMFLVEGDPTTAIESYHSVGTHVAGADAAFQRRLDTAFPPMYHEVLIDDEGRLVQDPLVQDQLRLAFDNDGNIDYRDWNLRTGRLQKMGVLMPETFGNWATLCRNMSDFAFAHVHSDPSLKSLVMGALATLSDAYLVACAQLAARSQVESGLHAAADSTHLANEERIVKALEHGLHTPTIRLDMIGAIWLTDRPCPIGSMS